MKRVLHKSIFFDNGTDKFTMASLLIILIIFPIMNISQISAETNAQEACNQKSTSCSSFLGAAFFYLCNSYFLNDLGYASKNQKCDPNIDKIPPNLVPSDKRNLKCDTCLECTEVQVQNIPNMPATLDKYFCKPKSGGTHQGLCEHLIKDGKMASGFHICEKGECVCDQCQMPRPSDEDECIRDYSIELKPRTCQLKNLLGMIIPVKKEGFCYNSKCLESCGKNEVEFWKKHGIFIIFKPKIPDSDDKEQLLNKVCSCAIKSWFKYHFHAIYLYDDQNFDVAYRDFARIPSSKNVGNVRAFYYRNTIHLRINNLDCSTIYHEVLHAVNDKTHNMLKKEWEKSSGIVYYDIDKDKSLVKKIINAQGNEIFVYKHDEQYFGWYNGLPNPQSGQDYDEHMAYILEACVYGEYKWNELDNDSKNKMRLFLEIFKRNKLIDDLQYSQISADLNRETPIQ